MSHLLLYGDSDELRLGAMLGDFIRGRSAMAFYPDEVWKGIELHRHTDQFVDSLPDVVNLRKYFSPPFRRYSGIVIDLAFDRELALRWEQYASESLESFDSGVRLMLAMNNHLVTDELRGFMSYADRRGLFAAYRSKSEILYSLRGLGTRLSRPNPLHRVEEIWDELAPRFSSSFELVFLQVQSEVEAWIKSRSTSSGS